MGRPGQTRLDIWLDDDLHGALVAKAGEGRGALARFVRGLLEKGVADDDDRPVEGAGGGGGDPVEGSGPDTGGGRAATALRTAGTLGRTPDPRLTAVTDEPPSPGVEDQGAGVRCRHHHVRTDNGIAVERGLRVHPRTCLDCGDTLTGRPA